MDGVVGDREEGMDRVMGRDGWSDSGWGGWTEIQAAFIFCFSICSHYSSVTTQVTSAISSFSNCLKTIITITYRQKFMSCLVPESFSTKETHSGFY